MVLVVIPAYNEEGKIGRVIRGLFEHGYREIVVINDGSTDNTAKEAEAAGATVISHRLNRGQGAALETGNEYARRANAEMVVHFDGDGQFEASDIGVALQMMKKNNAEVALGSRFLDGRSNIPLLKRYFILPVARCINFVFTGARLSDAHNGFRIMSKKALEAIRLTQDGMAHNTEFVKKLRASKLSFIEVPVKVSYHEYGQGLGGGVKILKELIISYFIG